MPRVTHNEFKGKSHITPADTKKLKEVFEKYASIERNGEKYMTHNDLVRNYLGMYKGDDYNPETVRIWASLASRTNEISFQQFQEFEHLLCTPDAIYQVVFQLFDTNEDDVISSTEFVDLLKKTEVYVHIPLDAESSFMTRYFGSSRNKTVHYTEFSQLLKDLQREHVLLCFDRADGSSDGAISVREFRNIMTSKRKHLLTDVVESNLSKISDSKINFPSFLALNSVLYEKELIKHIYLDAAKGNRKKEVPKKEFLESAQAICEISLLEVNMLYQLCNAIFQKETITYSDLESISTPHYFNMILGADSGSHAKGGALTILLEVLYHFALGLVGGGTGAAAVFPIDLVKTRIQNQRTDPKAKDAMYRGYFDCFFKVIRNEGILGLYRGLLPQLCGVSPEKATKLTVNDAVRSKFTDPDGNVPYAAEVLAGCCAGFCQVIVTNPLEIIKIRLQTAGEVKGGSKVRAREIIRDLGIKGLYKGVKACLCRDVTFAGIYFSTYGRLKRYTADKTGYNTPASLLFSGILAGVPAAGFATPFDVVKTRLQVIPRPGQMTYDGVLDAVYKIRKKEGVKAFSKGALARICRSSPQLGITLFTYEILQRLFPVDFGHGPTQGSVRKTQGAAKNADHIGGYSIAVPVFDGIETKFGLCFPKFRKPSSFSDS